MSKSQYDHKRAAIIGSTSFGITVWTFAEIKYFRKVLNLLSGLRIVL